MMSRETDAERARAAQGEVLGALLHHPSSAVLVALLDNPELDETQLCLLLERKDLPAEVLEEVAHRKPLLKSYRVKRALAFHVRTPRLVGLRLLRDLYLMDLVQLAISPAVSAAPARPENYVGSPRPGPRRRRPAGGRPPADSLDRPGQSKSHGGPNPESAVARKSFSRCPAKRCQSWEMVACVQHSPRAGPSSCFLALYDPGVPAGTHRFRSARAGRSGDRGGKPPKISTGGNSPPDECQAKA
jgi:hypothetical protein